MTATREALLQKLDDAYAVYYNRMPAASGVPGLSAAYEFHSSNECYVLSKKAKIWSAETNDYVYVFSVPELTESVYSGCRDAARDMGMARIRPHIDHMSSSITAVFLCDTIAQEAADMLRKTRIHKNFMLSLFGWMDFRAAAVALDDGRITANRAAKDLPSFLRGNLEKC